MSQSPLRVGIVGAGLVAQVIHLPVLSLLSHLYTVTAICDISKKTTDHCASKFHIPLATTNPTDIFTSPQIDLVFILTSDEFHEPYTIAALQAGKHVLLEKPITLSLPSAQRILAAERSANGPILFIGYMRRYAPSFTQTFLREVATIPRILYANVRDFAGPNARFVAQSGAPEVSHSDLPPAAVEERTARLQALYQEALPDQEITDEKISAIRFLGSLGSHDISLMRETLGHPIGVQAVSFHDPFYTALFHYRNRSGDGEPFTVTYESGLDDVPDFDAHVAVYGEKKRVTIRYDSPFIKGLPIKVTVQEVNAAGEFESRELLGSYEDAYTAELRELYACVVEGKRVKTSGEDALWDLKLFDEMLKCWMKSK